VRVMVNGRARDVTPGTTISQLIERTGADANGRGMAVAVNGEVVPRARWGTMEIDESDQVEVLGAAQGG
jgi:sulfur carrier protein